MDGVTFINTLVQNAKMRYLAIGKDFKCGSRGALHADAIVELCTALGIEAEIIPPVMDNGKPVSSSRIRAALSQNDYMLAEQLLGRRLNEPK